MDSTMDSIPETGPLPQHDAGSPHNAPTPRYSRPADAGQPFRLGRGSRTFASLVEGAARVRTRRGQGPSPALRRQVVAEGY